MFILQNEKLIKFKIENGNNGVYQNNEDYYLISIDTSLPHSARETSSKNIQNIFLQSINTTFQKVVKI